MSVSVKDRLEQSGLRPTRQRLLLGALLFAGGNRHFTAEELHIEAAQAGEPVSLATVYNTLRAFTGVGLVRQLPVEGPSVVFDTNTDPHHHFVNDGQVTDVPADSVQFSELPAPPAGWRIASVDVMIRLRPDDRSGRS